VRGDCVSIWVPEKQIDGDGRFRIGVIAPEGVAGGTVRIESADEIGGETEPVSKVGRFFGPGEHQFVLALHRSPRYVTVCLQVQLIEKRAT
jgi:hypothetical protein